MIDPKPSYPKHPSSPPKRIISEDIPIRKIYENIRLKRRNKMKTEHELKIEEHKLEVLLMKCKIGAYLKDFGFNKEQIEKRLDLGITKPVKEE